MHTAHIDPLSNPHRIQTCADHSRSVADLAKDILAPCGLSATGYLTGLLHDCGKFTEEFDDYITRASNNEQVRKGSVIHTFAGVGYLLRRFHAGEGGPFDALTSELLAAGIGSHHGLIDLWDEQHRNGFEHRLSCQQAYDQRAAEAFHRECASGAETAALFSQAAEEISFFCRQKIASYPQPDAETSFSLGLLARLITSAVVEGDRTDTRCFMQGVPLPEPCPIQWDECADHVNAHVSALPQETPIQRARKAFSDSCAAAAGMPPGLYRLDLPTGGGKTLAALRFAVLHAKTHRMRRIFYAAPLLSIIEQNAKALRKAVGDALPILEHHSNVLREETSSEEAARTELLQETWDVPFVATSFVQLLETLFSGKMSAVRRFHALCSSVIIIDEVQSLPPKMLSMFNCAVNFLAKCCGSTILLCSATQPPFDHPSIRFRMVPSTRLISEGLLDQYAPLFRRTEITDAGRCSMEELAASAETALDTAGSLLIICNTKGEAARLFRRCRDSLPCPVFHLSAGMCMAHRKKTLAELKVRLASGEKLLCVSTQVIEAGIDISFGSVIRLSAGLDSIVQAAGRCNRHGESASPRPVRICRLEEESLGPLREIRDAQNALNSLLASYHQNPEGYGNDLSSEAAVRAYYASLYQQMPVGYQNYCTNGHTLFDLLTFNRQLMPEGAPAYSLNQAFRTAGDWFRVFDSDSSSVIVPFEEGAELIEQLSDERLRFDLKRAAELLEQAKPYTVSLPADQIRRMMKNGMLYTLMNESLYVLNQGYYDNETGIKEGNDLCSTLIL